MAGSGGVSPLEVIRARWRNGERGTKEWADMRIDRINNATTDIAYLLDRIDEYEKLAKIADELCSYVHLEKCCEDTEASYHELRARLEYP